MNSMTIPIEVGAAIFWSLVILAMLILLIWLDHSSHQDQNETTLPIAKKTKK